MATATASASASGGAPPRGPLFFEGPIALGLLAIEYALIAAAVAVIIDAIRRPDSHYARPFWRWLWAGPQVVLLCFVLLRVVGGAAATAPIAGLILLWGVVCLVLDIGYLLEVVFPSPEDRERRRAHAEDAGQ